MNQLRFRGLELPVFDQDFYEILRTEDQYQTAVKAGHDSFVRIANIFAPGVLTLKDCLKITEDEFTKLEENSETKVVSHRWGLVKYDPRETPLHRRNSSEITLLPSRYLLCTEVTAIKVNEASNRNKHNDKQLRNEINAYVESGGLLSDIGIRQFTVGYEPKLAFSGNILHDIEPRLRTSWLRPFRNEHFTNIRRTVNIQDQIDVINS